MTQDSSVFLRRRKTPCLTVGTAVLLVALLFVVLTVGTASAQQAGTEKWSYETGFDITSSPTVVDGTVYVGSGDDNLYAVDAETGQEQWRFTTGCCVESSPSVVDGTVYFGSGDANIYALDAETGQKEWNYTTDALLVDSSPTVVDGTVYAGAFNGVVYAVDAETGQEEWTFQTGGIVESSPTVIDETVYVGSKDRNLYALNATSGDKRWEFGTGNIIKGSPTVSDDTVYFGTLDEAATSTPPRLYAVNAETGDEEWNFEITASVLSTPTVSDGKVYFGESAVLQENLYALDASDGTKEWGIEDDASVASSPTVASGTVYVGYVDGSLRAIDADTGTEDWSFQTGGTFPGIASSPTVADGVVYVGADNNNLYAVNTDHAESSNGSRVLQGTLGHNNVFDNRGPTQPGQDPANFEVTLDGTNSPVTAGEMLTVDVTVTNTGDLSDTQSVSLTVGGSERDSSPVTVTGGASVTETLEWETSGGDTGFYTASVETEDDDDSTPVTVELDDSGAAVSTENVTVAGGGDTAEGSVTVDAGSGVGTARLNVSVDTSVAEITNVEPGADVDPSDAGVTFSVVGQTDDSVRVEYTDSGADNGFVTGFEVAVVEFEAQTDSGDTPIQVLVDELRDGNTDPYSTVNEQEGNFSVGALFAEPLPGFGNPPTNTGELDPTLYEDVSGDGDGTDPSQAVNLWTQLVINEQDFDNLTQQQVDALDWNGDGQLTPSDAVSLWTQQVLV